MATNPFPNPFGNGFQTQSDIRSVISNATKKKGKGNTIANKSEIDEQKSSSNVPTAPKSNGLMSVAPKQSTLQSIPTQTTPKANFFNPLDFSAFNAPLNNSIQKNNPGKTTVPVNFSGLQNDANTFIGKKDTTATRIVSNMKTVDVDSAIEDLFSDVERKTKDGSWDSVTIDQVRNAYPELQGLNEDVLVSLVTDIYKLQQQGERMDDNNIERVKQAYPELVSASMGFFNNYKGQNNVNQGGIRGQINSAEGKGIISQGLDYLNPIGLGAEKLDDLAQNNLQIKTGTGTDADKIAQQLQSMTEKDFENKYAEYRKDAMKFNEKAYLKQTDEQKAIGFREWLVKDIAKKNNLGLFGLVSPGTTGKFTDDNTKKDKTILGEIAKQQEKKGNTVLSKVIGTIDEGFEIGGGISIPGVKNISNVVGTADIDKAIENLPESTAQTFTAIARAYTNPLDTAEGLIRLIFTKEGHEILKQRYATEDGWIEAIEEDPAGVISDLMMMGQMGAGALSKTASLSSKGLALTAKQMGATKFAANTERIAQRLEKAAAKLSKASGTFETISDMGMNKLHGALVKGLENIASNSNLLVSTAGTALKVSQKSPLETAGGIAKEVHKNGLKGAVGELLTGNVSPEKKLLSATNPTVNTLRGNKNYKVSVENATRADELITDYLTQHNKALPTNTQERVDAYKEALNYYWNEYQKRVKDKGSIAVNPNEIVEKVEAYLDGLGKDTLKKDDAQIKALKEEIEKIRNNPQDINSIENLKQRLNADWKAVTDKGDIYVRGLKLIGDGIRDIQDRLLSNAPGELRAMSKDIGAILNTMPDIEKSNIVQQRRLTKGGEGNALGKMSKYGGIGYSIATGNIGGAVAGIAADYASSAIGKVKDTDYKIKTGYEGLAEKRKAQKASELDRMQKQALKTKKEEERQRKLDEKKQKETIKLEQKKIEKENIKQINEIEEPTLEKTGKKRTDKKLTKQFNYEYNKFVESINNMANKIIERAKTGNATMNEIKALNDKIDSSNMSVDDKIKLKKKLVDFNNDNSAIGEKNYADVIKMQHKEGEVDKLINDPKKEAKLLKFIAEKVKNSAKGGKTKGTKVVVGDIDGAYGYYDPSYGEKLLKFVQNPTDTTHGHEFLHYTMDLLDSNSREYIINEAKKVISKELGREVSSLAAEEWIAEKFGIFMRDQVGKGLLEKNKFKKVDVLDLGENLNKIIPEKLRKTMAEMFNKVKNFIQSFGDDDFQKLFKEMLGNDYKLGKDGNVSFAKMFNDKFESSITREGGKKFRAVFQGSPNEFTKHSNDYMGSGEGNQVHGWGQYVAVNKETGEHYANTFGRNIRKEISYKGEVRDETKYQNNVLTKLGDEYEINYGGNDIEGFMEDLPNIKDRLESYYKRQMESLNEDYMYYKSRLGDNPTDAEIEKVDRIKKGFNAARKSLNDIKSISKDDISFSEQGGHNLYTIEIPDPVKADTPTGSNYLEEDGIISKEDIYKISDKMSDIYPEKAQEFKNTAWSNISNRGGAKGREVYLWLEAVLGTDKEASMFLNKIGYDGIHYFGYRDGECYVIFNTDKMQITDHKKWRKALEPKEQTKTKEFKDWFGKSKIVDKEGNPKIVYHGSPYTFNTFEGDKIGKNAKKYGPGFYFTDEKKAADAYQTHYNALTDKYEKWNNDKPRTIEAYISIENPIIIGKDVISKDKMKEVLNQGDYDFGFDNWLPRQIQSINERNIKEINGKHYTPEQVKDMSREKRVELYVDYMRERRGDIKDDLMQEFLENVSNLYHYDNKGRVLDVLRDVTGNDGVIYEGVAKWDNNIRLRPDQYVAWSSNQIKSATDNVGTFDKNNPDIRYRKALEPKSEYEEAVKRGDKDTAMGLLKKEAEKKGYKERNDDYKGRGAWRAPGADVDKKDFRNLELLKKNMDENAYAINLYALGNGISPQPLDMFERDNSWRNYKSADDIKSFEAVRAVMDNIQEQMDKYGEVKDMPKIKVYRAVPDYKKKWNEAQKDLDVFDIDDKGEPSLSHIYKLSKGALDEFFKYSEEFREGKDNTSPVKRLYDRLKGTQEISDAWSVKEGMLESGGEWVTPSKGYAQDHGKARFGGQYKIISEDVPADQLWWDGNDIKEWGFDDGSDYVVKKGAKNSRKTLDITYDDKGKLIPLEKRFDEKKRDARYRKALETKDEQKLIALHNLSLDKLGKTAKLGGMPMPSIAVTRAGIEHTDYGDISLIMKESAVNPKLNSKNKLYPVDGYTPMTPQPILKPKGTAEADKIIDKIMKETGRSYGDIMQWIEYKDQYENHYPELKKYDKEHDLITDKKLWGGFTPSGKRKYLDYNLENIVKQMKGNKEDAFNGMYWKMVSQNVGNIKDVNKLRNRNYGPKDAELGKKLFDDYYNAEYELFKKVGGDTNSFSASSNFGAEIARLYDKNVYKWWSKIRAENNFKNSIYMKIEQSDLEKLNNIISEGAKLQRPYSEAKPERAIRWDEVGAAVVPESQLKEAKEILKDTGVEVIGYKEGERQKVIDSVADKKGLKFRKMLQDEERMHVFHGAQKKFDKFDSSFMGSGEGAQVHGWGHYVTTNKNIARERYAKINQNRRDKQIEISIDGKPYNEVLNTLNDKEKELINKFELNINSGLDFDRAWDEVRREIKDGLSTAESRLKRYSPIVEKSAPDDPRRGLLKGEKGLAKKQRNDLKLIDELKERVGTDRHLYNVDIPAEKKVDTPTGSNYLDEEMILTDDQVNKFKEAIDKNPPKEFMDGPIKFDKEGLKNSIYSASVEEYDGPKYWLKGTKGIKAKILYRLLSEFYGSKKDASKFLESLGYDGIKYVGAVDGQSYVIFGDDTAEFTKHRKLRRALSASELPYELGLKEKKSYSKYNNDEYSNKPINSNNSKEMFDNLRKMVRYLNNSASSAGLSNKKFGKDLINNALDGLTHINSRKGYANRNEQVSLIKGWKNNVIIQVQHLIDNGYGNGLQYSWYFDPTNSHPTVIFWEGDMNTALNNGSYHAYHTVLNNRTKGQIMKSYDTNGLLPISPIVRLKKQQMNNIMKSGYISA